jgi:hypothetical protein
MKTEANEGNKQVLARIKGHSVRGMARLACIQPPCIRVISLFPSLASVKNNSALRRL